MGSALLWHRKNLRRPAAVASLTLGLIVARAEPGAAYSVLAHEAAIDASWESAIRPLLVRRFPGTAEAALEHARSFAYGGSVIQDLGYYPFGNRLFSDLVHYVRSGDFVEAMLKQAGDVDELAFALGALAHYADDNAGHPEAVNRSVPLAFPKLQAKFGNVVTYEQAPKQHVIVEFSFDVAHTARAAYPLSAYRNLIGFEVAVPLLERAFRDTYALEMRDLFGDIDRAVSTYRYAVSQIIPALTYAAWRDKRDEIERVSPAASQQTFVLTYRRADFERDFGSEYQKPALFARFLAFIYRFVPKVGPLKPLAFKVPTPDADRLFIKSVEDSNARFLATLAQFSRRRLDLVNTNFDTGQPTRRGEYGMADAAFDELVNRLSEHHFDGVTTELRRSILSFYGSDPSQRTAGRKANKQWARLQRALVELKNTSPAERTVAADDR